LVKKPENRARIVRDPKTLPTLSVFLQNGDAAVVAKTIEVLELLSQEPQVHAAMRDEAGLLTQVAAIVTKYKASVASTSSTGTEVSLPTVTSASSEPGAPATSTATTSNDVTSTYAATIVLGEKIAENLKAVPATKSESGAACPFTTPVKPIVETVVIPAVIKTEAKVVDPVINHVLFVKGLFGEEQREKIESALLATTGVLSFWFDIHQQKAEIRARIDEKSVIAAIKTSGFVAVAWRGEGSPHAPIKADGVLSKEMPKSVEDDSGYLDEKENIQHSYGSGGWLGTLSIFGKTPNKKKDAQPTPSKGLFGAIKSSWW